MLLSQYRSSRKPRIVLQLFLQLHEIELFRLPHEFETFRIESVVVTHAHKQTIVWTEHAQTEQIGLEEVPGGVVSQSKVSSVGRRTCPA